LAAKKPGGGARVYSFEAGYANLAALTTNVALNGLAGQVTPMPVALSDRTAIDVFNLRDVEPGGARHALGSGAVPEGGPALFPQPVLVFRLDDLVEQFRLPAPNHIKLDVDGGELAVLAGAARTLESPALRTVLIEVSTSLSDAVTEALGRRGLRLEARILKKNKAGEYAVWYGVFGRGGDPEAAVVTTEHNEHDE
jgi:FkbM family methyltransferase